VTLSKEILDFMAGDMCIDVDNLVEKIQEIRCALHQEEIYKIISGFHLALSEEDAEHKIQKTFLEYEHLFQISDVYAVIDPLRHAFHGFAYNGLHQLYTRQENEAWYPKIVLNRQIEPNDIESLRNPVAIYRGCDFGEQQTKKYGQSWTTSIHIAQLFAYKHYEHEAWFESRNRLVLKAVIPISAIYYSNQEGEFEVVVNIQHLTHIDVAHNNSNKYAPMAPEAATRSGFKAVNIQEPTS
jgi:DNA-binding XRE family transcriptional regulator